MRNQRHSLKLLPDEVFTATERELPDFDRDVAKTTFAIRALAQRINDDATMWLAPLGLNAARYNYLKILYGYPGLTPNELGRLIVATNAAVTSMLRTLEADGLVKRVAHRSDLRSSVLHLTPRAKRLIKRALPIHHHNLKRGMSKLSASDRRTLLNLLVRVGDGFEQHFGDRDS